MSQTALSFTRFLFLFLFFTASVKAQKEAKDFNVDSTLYAYYQRCQECLLQPVVLSMSDTLYRMAEERHDKRMQAVAISTQLDYHYFQATNEDSIIYYTNKVKDFAKATQQPKYYYFAWSNRLILYYLKNGRTNIALYEAQKMLKEAQEEDDKTGLSRCYNIMSQIYTVKRLDSMAFEWQLKEIELTEKYDLENYNISQTYSQISSYYINTNQPEKALEALGFDLPDPDKPLSRRNNRKITFDAACRKMLFEIAKRHGLDLEEEAEYGNRKYLEKQDFILAKQKEQLAAQQSKLDELTLKVSDMETLLEDVSAAAYDKAVEVVTDVVRTETRKEDMRMIEDTKKWVLSPERKAPQATREYAAHRLDTVLDKFLKTMQTTATRLQEKLLKPEVRQKGKEQVKEKARDSVLQLLNRLQAEQAQRKPSVPPTAEKSETRGDVY